jgi:actin-related protein
MAHIPNTTTRSIYHNVEIMLNVYFLNGFIWCTIVEDWDALEAIFEYSYKDRLRLDSSEHPLLFTEPAWNPKETREKLIELAFEKFNVPAFYLAKGPALAA